MNGASPPDDRSRPAGERGGIRNEKFDVSIPRHGPDRLAWLRALDAVLVTDLRSTVAAHIVEAGPDADPEWIATGYRDFITTRIGAVLDDEINASRWMSGGTR